MASLTYQWVQQFILTDTQGVKSAIRKDNSLTSQSEAYRVEAELDDSGAGATQVLFDPVNWSGFPVTKATAAVFLAEVDCKLEFTVKEGDGNEVLFALSLPAGWPLALPSLDSFYNYTDDVFAGISAPIDKIRVTNASSPAAAGKVWMTLVDNS